MASLRNLSRWDILDIVLVIIIVVGVIVARSQYQSNQDAEEELVRLETGVKIDQMTLNQAAQNIDLASLQQDLERAQAALSENALPREASAVAVTGQIMRYALQNNIDIVRWVTSHTSANQTMGTYYYMISHSLVVEGEAEALISFMKDLRQASVTPVVSAIDITAVGEEAGTLQMRLEPYVFYRRK